MSDILNEIGLYFDYSFVRYAFIVGLLISICSSLVGVVLVLKRFSYIGDGLSHVAFGAMAVSTILGVTQNMFVVMPITIIVAILLLKSGNGKKISGDASIAMISVASLAIGYLILNVFSTSSNIAGDVCTTLFGSTSILTLSRAEVILCIIMSLIVVCFFVLFFNKIFAVTFDENFAKATGMKVEILNISIAVITAIIIVLAMNLVGALLISALILFPSLSAMRLVDNYKGVTVLAVIISVLCASIGMLISIIASTPVGATIVAANIIVYIIAYVLSLVRGNN